MKAQKKQSSDHPEPGSHRHSPVLRMLQQLLVASTSAELNFNKPSGCQLPIVKKQQPCNNQVRFEVVNRLRGDTYTYHCFFSGILWNLDLECR